MLERPDPLPSKPTAEAPRSFDPVDGSAREWLAHASSVVSLAGLGILGSRIADE